MKRFNELKNSLIIKLVLTFSLILFSMLLNKPIVYAAGTEFEFNYTGDYQTFIVPKSWVYKLETWGAQGGDRGASNGGKGGYTSGEISPKFDKNMSNYEVTVPYESNKLDLTYTASDKAKVEVIGNKDFKVGETTHYNN